MKKPVPMKSYRLQAPVTGRVHGQGRIPACYCHTGPDGERSEIPFGEVAEARQSCRYPFEFSQGEGKWLVHTDFLKTTKSRWKQL